MKIIKYIYFSVIILSCSTIENKNSIDYCDPGFFNEKKYENSDAILLDEGNMDILNFYKIEIINSKSIYAAYNNGYLFLVNHKQVPNLSQLDSKFEDCFFLEESDIVIYTKSYLFSSRFFNFKENRKLKLDYNFFSGKLKSEVLEINENKKLLKYEINNIYYQIFEINTTSYLHYELNSGGVYFNPKKNKRLRLMILYEQERSKVL